MAFTSWISFTLLVITCWPYMLTPSLTQPIAPEWSRKETDVYFLLDSSSSVWIRDYREMTDMVANMVSNMDIGPDRTRVGLGVFSERFHEHIPINNTFTKDELIQRVKAAPYISGNTYISRAIQGMRTIGFGSSGNKARKTVPHICVLFTDGSSRYKQLTLNNATLAKQEGVSIFTVGIGWNVDNDELSRIASEGDQKWQYYWRVYNFGELHTIKDRLAELMATIEFNQNDEGAVCGRDTTADIQFVFDEARIGTKNSKKIKDFIADLVMDLNVDSGKVRVGVISQSCATNSDIQLNYFKKKSDFKAKLLEDISAEVMLAKMLPKVYLESFREENGGRSNSQKRIVLFITEPVSQKTPLKLKTYSAKSKGIKIFVVRIGTNYNKTMLTKLASSENHVQFFDTIDHLSAKEFSSKFCIGL